MAACLALNPSKESVFINGEDQWRREGVLIKLLQVQSLDPVIMMLNPQEIRRRVADSSHGDILASCGPSSKALSHLFFFCPFLPFEERCFSPLIPFRYLNLTVILNQCNWQQCLLLIIKYVKGPSRSQELIIQLFTLLISSYQNY